jgi:hypothetical protein
MASTSRSVGGLAVLAAGTAAVVALGTAWLSGGGHDEPARVPFWETLSGAASEFDPPDDLPEIASRSTDVVVARVTGVVEGRLMEPYSDPTPSKSGMQGIRTVFVQLTLDKVLKGTVRPQQVLKLEMFAPPVGVSLDSVRDNLPTGQGLYFLRNKEALAKKGGWSAEIQQREHAIWDVASLMRGVVAENTSGLYEPLEAHDGVGGKEFLQSFHASTLDGAVASTEAALR